MISRLARIITATLLAGAAGVASATTPAVDIFHTAGVPGTGGYSTILGPCYCTQPAYFSPVMLLQPGTYDFGKVREYWVESGFTPDGGPDQPVLYLLFDPVQAEGSWPYDIASPPDYAYPATDLCAQDDAACNARYANAYQDFDLTMTVAPGDNAVQIGLIGRYLYTSPVPEPLPAALLLLGLAVVARASTATRARSA